MNYRCEIYTKRAGCNGHEFAVKFIDAGDFPDKEIPVHDIVNGANWAIVAATDKFENAWSYVNLSGDEKDCVGARMLEAECDQDIWYWCELFTD